ncbi:allantoicase [Oricola sp.]|uniref:allantoicase n=1 Tax=Oricola sp. TaxID=1979950 RepID=UPI003BA92E31
MSDQTGQMPSFANRYANLASAGLGATVVSATDDFFAEAPRMLADTAPVFIPDKYDENGKWMDGWESRRKRGEGHDHAVVKLAAPAVIRGFDIDTSHFTGNFPPACSIEGCRLPADAAPDGNTVWQPILPIMPLGADSHHFAACDSNEVWTHLRLNIFPDGGVARLRVYGVAHAPDIGDSGETDLASIMNGARIVGFSDAHYGNYHRLLTPTVPKDMGDGWETRRRREPGNDWIIVALGAAGIAERAIIDTAYYKGNFPESCSIDAAFLPNALEAGPDADAMLVTASMFWTPLMGRQTLHADRVHEFTGLGAARGPITHVKLNIFPDGGVSRFKLFGTRA